MFEAIRRKLVGAWRHLRERDLVTLFFFELTVVTLGVVLAQGVAEWAGDRSDLAAMERARARADLEMGDAAAVGQLWQRLAPCILQDIDAILRAANTGETVDADLLKRPNVFTNTVMPMAEQNKLLIRERYGDEVAYNYDRMQRLTGRLDSKASEIVDLWGRLALIDPALGNTEIGDRQFARQTAASIRANLQSIAAIADGTVEMAERMNLEPKILGEQVRAAENCKEYRAFGSDFAKPETSG